MTIRLSRDDLMRVVRQAPPSGWPTHEIASRLRVPVKRITSRLSKLALYGWIDREVVPRYGPGQCRVFHWKPNPPVSRERTP